MEIRKKAFFAVFGNPIVHSLSPHMHNAAFQAEKMESIYIPVTCSEPELVSKLDAFVVLGGYGVNLTRPLKERVISHLDSSSDWVLAAGAANTLWWTGNGWAGENTDCMALMEHLQPAIGRQRALLLGAGGVARASYVVLRRLGYDVVVAARSPQDIEWAVEVISWDERMQLNQLSVVVNATPLGQVGELQGADWPVPRAGGVAVDWVYRPRDTVFLQKARDHHSRVVDGLMLLVSQASFAWQPWFHRHGPWKVMWDAVAPWH